MTPAPLRVRTARADHEDPFIAVRALAEQLDPHSASAAFLFCSPSYDLEHLGVAIARAFPVPTTACTSTGQLGASGFERGGIMGVCLWSSSLTMTPLLLPAISSGPPRLALPASRAHRNPERRGAFGVMLTDGSSGVEEYVAAAAYQALGDVPIVGGSASGEGEAAPAAVYHGGRFHRDAAVLALCETDSLPFATFRAHYFRPGPRRVVTTLADADERIIYELNGEPAASVYAELLDTSVGALDASLCAQSPLMLTVGDRSYVRSVKSVNPDQSLSLHCAIEEGLVLSIAEPEDPVQALQRSFAALPDEVTGAPIVLAFDSYLDRDQLASRGREQQVSSFLSSRRVRGCSGVGSQLGPIHFNQTLTGIALGNAASVGAFS